MLRVADFYKVSPKQFVESIRDEKPSLSDSEILDMYNHVLKLPERAQEAAQDMTLLHRSTSHFPRNRPQKFPQVSVQKWSLGGY